MLMSTLAKNILRYVVCELFAACTVDVNESCSTPNDREHKNTSPEQWLSSSGDD